MKRERVFHLNGGQIEREARFAIPSLRADAREPPPDPRRGHAHDLRCGRTEREGGENRHREPLRRDKQRDQTMKPRAYPARSGGGGGGRRRRRRGGARRRRSRHSGPCRTSARARCSPPPRPRPPPTLSLLSPFPTSASTRRNPRGNPCIAGAEGGRGSPILACARSHGRIDHEGCPHDAPRRWRTPLV
jgi:hypothetical protein